MVLSVDERVVVLDLDADPRRERIRVRSYVEQHPVGGLKWIQSRPGKVEEVVKVVRGQADLAGNPFSGLLIPREESPNRPVCSDARYAAMLAVARDIDWRFEVALVLAHETGHRIGSVRLLRWSDVSLSERRIRWPQRYDKIGFEHVAPLTPEAMRLLRQARARSKAIGETWVLPAPGDPAEPCSRHLMRDWWKRAEDDASLPPVKGLGWHSLRRKFATELRDQPLKVLCDLGGWKDPHTVLKCYQFPDQDTLESALKARKRGTSGQ